MGKISHSLTVSFRTDGDEELYRGTSFARKGIEDQVVIKESSITISFERAKQKLPEEVLDSSMSYIRTHLERALMYYLAVKGNIPECDGVTYRYGFGKTESMEGTAEIIRQWKDFKVNYTLSPEACGRLFRGSDGELLSLVNPISFFLWSQLSDSPHEAFRAAWSSLNALYTNIAAKDTQEEKKLRKLSEFIKGHDMERACGFVMDIDNDRFWKDLRWYGFMEKNASNWRFKTFFQEQYADEAKRDALLGDILYSRLFDKIEACQELKDESRDRADFFAGKKDSDKYCVPVNRVEFLVCFYCYYKRNKSVHAGDAYPLFIISEKSENYAEPVLTELLWNVISDIIEEKYGACES